jgi:uncharacterized protein with ParB-like and HNH nuclease domain
MVPRGKAQQKALADILFPVRPEGESGEVLNIPPEKRRLHTETYDFTISTIYGLIKDKKIVIPEFQRRYVWSRAQASRLIESLIIQCPIPVIYLDQGSEGTLTVVDGNQRLMSVKLFLENGFRLKGLKAYPDLDGSTFAELDPRFQNHIENRTLRCITILKDTHPQIKFDVFERLNTGAVQLNPQELRHGLNFGPLMQEIDNLASDDEWQEFLGIKNDKRMRGAELILRFFALRFDLARYKKPLAGFLSEFAAKHKDKTDLDEWKDEFKKTYLGVKKLFGKAAFRMLDENLKPGSSINSAVFDAQMVGFSLIQAHGVQIDNVDQSQILSEYYKLQSNPDFNRAITASTSDELLVRTRINLFRDFLVQNL